MSQPPEQPARPPGDRGGSSNTTAIKAGLVLVAFVVTTVLVLGVIHPTASTTTSAIPTASTTTTPAAPTTTTTTAPPRVPVQAANASGVPGAAEAVTSQLQTAGWDMLPPVNAAAQVTATNVYYVAGQRSAAQLVAKALVLPASSVAPYTTSAPVTSIGTAGVVVVIGPDLANRTTTTTTSSTPG